MNAIPHCRSLAWEKAEEKTICDIHIILSLKLALLGHYHTFLVITTVSFCLLQWPELTTNGVCSLWLAILETKPNSCQSITIAYPVPFSFPGYLPLFFNSILMVFAGLKINYGVKSWITSFSTILLVCCATKRYYLMALVDEGHSCILWPCLLHISMQTIS